MPSWTAIVDRAGEEFLAGSGLAKQQNGGVRAGDLTHAIERVAQHRAVADDLVEPVECLDLLTEVDRFGLELRRQTCQLRLAQPQRPRLTAPVDGERQDFCEQLDAADDDIAPRGEVARTREDQRTGALPGHPNRHADRGSNALGAIAGPVEYLEREIVRHSDDTHMVAAKETDNVHRE